MVDNLADMIRQHSDEQGGENVELNSEVTAEVTAEENGVTSEEVTENPETTPAPEDEDLEYDIETSNLTDWFEANHNNFGSVNHVKVSIRGIDPQETLIFAVLDSKGGEDPEGNPKRELFIWKESKTFPVLNIPGTDMDVYNNGLKIIYQYNNVILKCYAVRTGLNITFCMQIDDKIIPYEVVKMKRKDFGVNVPALPDATEFRNRLESTVDLESLQLQYKQIGKHIENISTVSSAIEWFLERQVDITDVNHHLQIDKVMVDLMTA